MNGAGALSLPRALRVAFGLLTRLPIGVADPAPRELGAAVAFLPLIGGVLGAVLLALRYVLPAALPVELGALVLIATLALLTGGLHLDGLADVFDGVGGGRGDRERTLSIMRDSRIGAFGTIALVLVLLGKVLALAHAGSWQVALFPLAGRLGAVPLVVFFACARPDGLAHTFATHARPWHAVLAFATGVAAVALAGVWAIVPVLVALAIGLLIGAWMQRRIGGMTGDVYGAAIELGELGFLIAAAV